MNKTWHKTIFKIAYYETCGLYWTPGKLNWIVRLYRFIVWQIEGGSRVGYQNPNEYEQTTDTPLGHVYEPDPRMLLLALFNRTNPDYYYTRDFGIMKTIQHVLRHSVNGKIS